MMRTQLQGSAPFLAVAIGMSATVSSMAFREASALRDSEAILKVGHSSKVGAAHPKDARQLLIAYGPLGRQIYMVTGGDNLQCSPVTIAVVFCGVVAVIAIMAMIIRHRTKEEKERLAGSTTKPWFQPEISGSENTTEQAVEDSGNGAVVLDRNIIVTRRLIFLSLCMAVTIVPVLIGILVHKLSNSLVVELDAISLLADVISIMVNILVEMAKRRAKTDRQILILDMVGAGVSLAVLIVVGVYGIILASGRAIAPDAVQNRVKHLGYMFGYTGVALTCDGLVMALWLYMRKSMSTSSEATSDALNTTSSVMHIVVNAIQDLAVALSAGFIFALSCIKDIEAHVNEATVFGDLVASIVVCICIIGSAGFMLRESLAQWKRYQMLFDISAEEPEVCRPKD